MRFVSQDFVFLILDESEPIYSILSPQEIDAIKSGRSTVNDEWENDRFEPVFLLTLIEKIAKHLQDDIDAYPLYHWLSNGNNCTQNRLDVVVDSIRCTVDGHHKHSDHRNELWVSSWNEDIGKINYWVPAKETLQIGDTKITVHTESVYQFLKKDIDVFRATCLEAQASDQLMRWSIDG